VTLCDSFKSRGCWLCTLCNSQTWPSCCVLAVVLLWICSERIWSCFKVLGACEEARGGPHVVQNMAMYMFYRRWMPWLWCVCDTEVTELHFVSSVQFMSTAPLAIGIAGDLWCLGAAPLPHTLVLFGSH